jgi:hypothetical protein
MQINISIVLAPLILILHPPLLVNTGHGTPFVSVLELRPLGRLGGALYQLVTPGLVISMFRRINMGAGVSIVRYVLVG